MFKLIICDQYFEGAYIPKDNEIFLCSNALYTKIDFQNAMTRMLIKLYDHKRATNYDFSNCKHLACTEIRAANFNTKCGMSSKALSSFKGKQFIEEQISLDKYCVKSTAI